LPVAVTALLSASVRLNSQHTYSSQFRAWVRVRTARRLPVFLDGRNPVGDQEALVEFVAFKGYIQGYAHGSVHVMLYALRYYHLLNRHPDPLQGAALLKMAMKGLKNMQGGSQQKVAATPDILLEAAKELDVDTWDGLITLLALAIMFVFLLRSREALRKGAEPDPEQCLRVQDTMLAASGEVLTLSEFERADELVLLQGKSKADQEGQGHMANAFASGHVLCPVDLYKRAVRMRPEHFADGRRFLFTKSDGKVLSRDAVAGLLRRAGRRRGLPKAALSVISLRSGGASAMFHEGYSAEEIKRRGRWQSECWRTYVWASRERGRELAGKMLGSSFSLLASLARYERRI
jgi:hypothetical protein